MIGTCTTCLRWITVEHGRAQTSLTLSRLGRNFYSLHSLDYTTARKSSNVPHPVLIRAKLALCSYTGLQYCTARQSVTVAILGRDQLDTFSPHGLARSFTLRSLYQVDTVKPGLGSFYSTISVTFMPIQATFWLVYSTRSLPDWDVNRLRSLSGWPVQASFNLSIVYSTISYQVDIFSSARF